MKTRRFGVRIGLVLGALALAATALAGGPRDPYEHFFDQTLGDFSEELEVAREEGKKGVVLFFEMDECPFCYRMRETVLNQPQVQDYYRANFLSFPVDVESDVEIVDFQGNATTAKDFAARKNRVRATPMFAFYDLDGQRVVRYTGATSGLDEFLWLGQYAAEGVYRDMKFTKYKRLRRAQARGAADGG